MTDTPTFHVPGLVPTGPLMITSRVDVPDGHTYEGYVRTGGYEALRKALTMTPEQVHAEESLGVKAGSTTPDGLFTLEGVECIAACTEAPALQVNYRYRYRVTEHGFDELIDDLRAGRLDDEIPPHGTLARVRQVTTDAWANTGTEAQARVDAR